MPMIAAIADRHAELTDWRRKLHAYPELGFEETRTAAFVAERLAAAGFKVSTGIARTGVVGVIEGRPGSRRIGLRSDMDALPMAEGGSQPWRSTRPGHFHGCGHDGHVVMLLAAAEHLARTRDFPGTLTVIFQPAEEGLGGGRLMVEEGLFERFPCDEIYALHTMPLLPVGQASVRRGAALASFDRFSVTITGRGGHAATPHRTIDPGLTMAHVVVALQSLISRELDPLEAAVLSVTELHSGSSHNIIPEQACFSGTIRALNEDSRGQMEAGFRRMVEHVVQAHGATAEITYEQLYPVLTNDPVPAARATRAIQQVFGESGLAQDFPPLMAAEDFAFMLQRCPGAYILVGEGTGPNSPMVHHPEYDFNDAILPLGASLFVNLVEEH